MSVAPENGEEWFVKKSETLGTSLDGRRLLGKFEPYARFVTETEDLPAPEP